ncbi:glycosyl transferase [Anaerocolumna cellulosilytica]|uniref:Glycosyl transferase n=1 Tax=Anaerocolumna cellulosilytica TaxID=433286 RepID=A0A6S6R5U6_9FIRM|nr:glycosyltransferase family 2 protein [Anaerocolumna cellulosilytica]MBB5195236.1 glycosyltransferase involved in cell wall biosynthesis [Anaerocolumna cellulosilytica]BCJ96709.1 glycosyl transferase [Anaerocolumna cellulosilytica]
MKLLSVAIPCYNSADYMEHAIETLLTGGTELEIIIVDDGSVDDTPQIADKYAAKYPNIIKVIHQENGGHGEAVNTGLTHSTGLYFKVVDSDDWVNEGDLLKVLCTLRELVEDGKSVDLMICNYVYEKPSINKRKIIDYKTALPQNKVFTWNDIMYFKQSQNILMHAAIYRTKLLRDCGLKLPKHTFYVDNIFVYQPLPFVKTMYYLDVNLYRYFIGRDDQSVNEKNMIKRVDQQIRITKIMIDSHDIMTIKDKKLKNYMIKYLCVMMMVSSVYLIKENTEESLKKKQELWEYLEKSNAKLYKKILNKFLGRSMNLPGRTGRKIVELGFKISKKIYGFS